MSLRNVTGFVLCLLASQGIALPSKCTQKRGEVSIQGDGFQIKITQKTNRAIVHFEDFSIGKNERVSISQPSNKSALLGRVTGPFPSTIDGELIANGCVYLMSPKGVMVGPEGVIKTNEFIASTLDIADRDFLESNRFHFKGESTEKIVNLGTIEALTGNISLIACEVEQAGNLLAKQGDVCLIGASDVFLVPDSKSNWMVQPRTSGSVNSTGTIEALRVEIHAAGGSAFSLALNHLGVIEDKGISLNGEIIANQVNIQGDKIDLLDSVKIDAPEGGSIFIGNDRSNVVVDSGARIKANGGSYGDGGTVKVLGNNTSFAGAIESRGGDLGGDGGFVEVSGYQWLEYLGKTDTRAPYGDFGTLLLDPTNLTISTGIDTATNTNNGTLATNLALGNVTITTTTGGTDPGTLNWMAGAPVSWSEATTLTLISDQAMTLASNVTNTHSGSPFKAMEFTANAAGAPAGDFSGIELSGELSAVDGEISLTGTGGDSGGDNYGVDISGSGAIRAIGIGPITIIGTGGAASGGTNNGVSISGSGEVHSESGSISITGIGGAAAGSDNNGVAISAAGKITTNTGAIFVTGTGGASPGGNDNNGIFISSVGEISSVSGDISLIGTGGGDAGMGNHGIKMSAGEIRSGSGSMSLLGNAPTNGEGISIAAIIGGASTGDLSFEADTIEVLGSTIRTSGEIVFQPLSSESTIGVSGGLGTFNLTSAELDTIQSGAKCLTFGRENGVATITVGPYHSFNAPTIFRNRAFALNGNIVTTANHDFTVIADTAVIGYGDKMITSGTVTFKPQTPATTIGLGNSSAGEFNLNATELSQIMATQGIIFGSPLQTGAVDITGFAYTTPLTVYSDTIEVRKAISGPNITFNVGPVGDGTLTLTASVATTGTFLAMGGINNDTFNLFMQPTGMTIINGAGGTNTLSGPSFSANAWVVSGIDSGTLNTNVRFSNIGSLFGGASGDIFSFANQKGLSGSILGGGNPFENTLDYRLYTTPVNIHLVTDTSGVASNLGKGFSDIGFVIGKYTFSSSFRRIGMILAGINEYEPFYEPKTIQYRQFSILNGIIALPNLPKKIAYTPGVIGRGK